jgi:hypothetical protein
MLVVGAAETVMSLMMPSSALPATCVLLVVVLEGHTERWPPTPGASAEPATLAALVGPHLCIEFPLLPGICWTSSIAFAVLYSTM